MKKFMTLAAALALTAAATTQAQQNPPPGARVTRLPGGKVAYSHVPKPQPVSAPVPLAADKAPVVVTPTPNDRNTGRNDTKPGNPNAAVKALPVGLRGPGELTPVELSKKLDAVDQKVADGLAELKKALEALDKDRKSWAELDKTVQAAKKVNAALMEKCDSMLKTYDDRIGPALKDLKTSLQNAPASYRAMAADRRAKAKAAESGPEFDAYTAMADVAEAAAVLCERRYREVFADATPHAASIADTLAAGMERVRRMRKVHADWAETLEGWPSVLSDPKLAALLDQLNGYATDLVDYQKGVTELAAALKAKAAEEGRK